MTELLPAWQRDNHPTHTIIALEGDALLSRMGGPTVLVADAGSLPW